VIWTYHSSPYKVHINALSILPAVFKVIQHLPNCRRDYIFGVKQCETAVNTSWILWGWLFGSVGFGFFVYGKKQKAVVPLVCGLALMVFPYFIANTILLVAMGAALMALPYFVRI